MTVQIIWKKILPTLIAVAAVTECIHVGVNMLNTPNDLCVLGGVTLVTISMAGLAFFILWIYPVENDETAAKVDEKIL